VTTAKTVAVPVYRLHMVKERTVSYAAERCLDGDSTAAVLHALLDDSDRERLYVIALNARSAILGVNEAGMGGSESCPVDRRNVLKFALLANARSIILGHNHSSGDPTPSAEDVELTLAVASAAEQVGIKLLDHVIVAPSGGHYSMHQHMVAGLG
jgi:DNA repair protein RadC